MFFNDFDLSEANEEVDKTIHCVPGESILCHKYAFIKKSTIFPQSSRNFDIKIWISKNGHRPKNEA